LIGRRASRIVESDAFGKAARAAAGVTGQGNKGYIVTIDYQSHVAVALRCDIDIIHISSYFCNFANMLLCLRDCIVTCAHHDMLQPSRRRMQEMQHWYESEEYQLEMAQRQLDFDEKNMSSLLRTSQ